MIKNEWRNESIKVMRTSIATRISLSVFKRGEYESDNKIKRFERDDTIQIDDNDSYTTNNTNEMF